MWEIVRSVNRTLPSGTRMSGDHVSQVESSSPQCHAPCELPYRIVFLASVQKSSFCGETMKSSALCLYIRRNLAISSGPNMSLLTSNGLRLPIRQACQHRGKKKRESGCCSYSATFEPEPESSNGLSDVTNGSSGDSHTLRAQSRS